MTEFCIVSFALDFSMVLGLSRHCTTGLFTCSLVVPDICCKCMDPFRGNFDIERIVLHVHSFNLSTSAAIRYLNIFKNSCYSDHSPEPNCARERGGSKEGGG